MPKYKKSRRLNILKAQRMNMSLRAQKGSECPKFESGELSAFSQQSFEDSTGRAQKGSDCAIIESRESSSPVSEQSFEDSTRRTQKGSEREIIESRKSSLVSEQSFEDSTRIRKSEMASTTGDWMIEQHLCRCCHSEGKFKSLISTDPVMEDELLYLDALRFCLDIELCLVEGPLAYAACTICETCLSRLQEACCFRRQVLSCEGRFQALYSENRIKVASSAPVVKEELPDPDDSYFGDNNDRDIDSPCIDNDKVGVESVTSPPKHGSSMLFQLLTDDASSLPEATKAKRKRARRIRESDYEQTGDKFKCKQCSKILSSLHTLRFHIRSRHLADHKYNCSLCNASFHTIPPFVKHKLEEHNIDDRLKCNACDSVFNSKPQLIKHKNSFHMLGEKYKCQQCDYECFSVEALYKHKFKHKTVKDYHCKYCKKSFLRKTTLDLHERIHTGDRRKVCAECGQAFVQKASLNYHMTKYHPEVNY